MEITKTGLLPFDLNEDVRKVYPKISRVLSIHRGGLLLILMSGMLSLFLCGYASAQEKKQVVRLAKLQIDSTQLETYKAALKEEIETSVRMEPGVVSLYAMSEKENPSNITIFEIYADEDAYKAHRETPHFKKYKSATREMVKSLELKEAVPIVLATKAK